MTVPDGVDYESLDGQPAHLFFMIAAPADEGSTLFTGISLVIRIING